MFDLNLRLLEEHEEEERRTMEDRQENDQKMEMRGENKKRSKVSCRGKGGKDNIRSKII